MAETYKQHVPTTDKDLIIDLADQLVSKYDDRNKQLNENLLLYDEVGIHQDIEEQEVYRVVVPDGQSAIDLVCDLISSQDINLTIPAAADKATEKKDAETIRRFSMAWFRMMQREEDLDIKRELGQDGTKLGAGCLRLVVDNDRIPQKGDSEAQKADYTFPIVPEVRSYDNIFPVFRRSRLVAVLDSYQVTVLDAKLDFPDLAWPADWDNDSMITMNEYWTNTHHALWVKGAAYNKRSMQRSTDDKRGCLWIQDPFEHKYGRIPYILRFIRGETKYRNDPAKQSRGYLQTWKGTLKILNAIESAKVTAGMSYTNNAWLVTTGRQDFKLDLRGNKVNYLRPEENVDPLQRGQVPVDLMQMSSEWGQRFERQSVPNTVYGEGINNSMAGYAIALQGEAGRRILQPATKLVEECLADMFSTFMVLIEEYLGPLYKERGIPLVAYTYESGEDYSYRDEVELDYNTIKGMRYTEVTIGNPMPQDDERAVAMAQQLRNPDAAGTPLASDETIHEKILKNDPREERMRIWRQKMQGIIFESVVQEVMTALGIGGPGEDTAGQMDEMMQMVDERLGQLEQQVMSIEQEHDEMMSEGGPQPPPTQLPEMMPDEYGSQPDLPPDAGGFGQPGPAGAGIAGPPAGPPIAGPGPADGAGPSDLAGLLAGAAGQPFPAAAVDGSPAPTEPGGPGSRGPVPGPDEEVPPII